MKETYYTLMSDTCAFHAMNTLRASWNAWWSTAAVCNRAILQSVSAPNNNATMTMIRQKLQEVFTESKLPSSQS